VLVADYQGEPDAVLVPEVVHPTYEQFYRKRQAHLEIYLSFVCHRQSDLSFH
jgi:hypothetical protein